MALCVASSAVKVARQESFSHRIQCQQGSTTRLLRVHGTTAAARQRRSTFLIRIQTESTRQCAFAARDMDNGSNRDGAVSWRDEAPPNGRKACHFSPQWPNLLGSETNMAAIQDCDRAGHHTFMPMTVMLLFGWMVGDDAAAIKQC